MCAAALAFNTLLALIPVLALGAGIVAGVLQQEDGKAVDEFVERLVQQVTPLPEQVRDPAAAAQAEAMHERLTAGILKFVGNFRASGLHWISTLLLLWLSLRVMNQLENAFNDLWDVAKPRRWFSRILTYLPVVLLGPFCLGIAIAISNGPRFQAVEEWLLGLPWFLGTLVGWGTHLLPFLFASLAFTLAYWWLPNTRVSWRAAAVGGLVAGVLWQLNHLLGTLYVTRVVVHDQIYGSLGLIPVFMISLYLSWLIVLLGAQVAAQKQEGSKSN